MAQRWRICGRVQGVGYRDWMVRAADAAGVDGCVRNVPAGEVEAFVDGEAGAVAALLAAARRGPPFAAVSSIEVENAASRGEPGFARRPDRA